MYYDVVTCLAFVGRGLPRARGVPGRVRRTYTLGHSQESPAFADKNEGQSFEGVGPGSPAGTTPAYRHNCSPSFAHQLVIARQLLPTKRRKNHHIPVRWPTAPRHKTGRHPWSRKPKIRQTPAVPNRPSVSDPLWVQNEYLRLKYSSMERRLVAKKGTDRVS